YSESPNLLRSGIDVAVLQYVEALEDSPPPRAQPAVDDPPIGLDHDVARAECAVGHELDMNALGDPEARRAVTAERLEGRRSDPDAGGRRPLGFAEHLLRERTGRIGLLEGDGHELVGD